MPYRGGAMANPGFDRRVEAVRRFSRFYTKQIGLLREHLLGGPFSLTEARVLYEMAHHEPATASELGRDLALDAGYLSRLLRDFRKRGLIVRRRSDRDGRRSLLRLTDKGHQAFATLNAASRHEVGAVLARLPDAGRKRLVDECLAFARAAGYRRIMLWTNDVLHAARHIYERTGFRLTAEERHTSFGHDLAGQTW